MPQNITDFCDLFDYDTKYVDYLTSDNVEMRDLPENIAKMFKHYIEEYSSQVLDDECNADVDVEDRLTIEDLEFDAGICDHDGRLVYRLGMHEPSPFNPSGFELYFYADCTYLGFCES